MYIGMYIKQNTFQVMKQKGVELFQSFFNEYFLVFINFALGGKQGTSVVL